MRTSAISFPEKIRTPSIVIGAALLTALHREFGSASFIASLDPGLSSTEAVGYLFASTFLLFAVIPITLVRTAFRISLKDIGLQPGDWRFGLKAVLIALPPLVLLLSSVPHVPDIGKFYPLDSSAGDSLGSFVRHELLRAIFFYGSWEVLFRGVMIFGIAEETGSWTAVCIQVLPSSLWHIGNPSSELLASIPAGLLLGMLAMRTRSIYWSWMLHFLIGLIVDIYLLTA